MLYQAYIDMGISPSTEDAPYISAGTFPPTWWSSSTDSIHMNTNGYTAVGRIVYNTLKQLGTFKTI